MLRATTIVRKPAVRPDAVADTITLDHAARLRREGAFTAEKGLAFRLDLARAAGLEDGDALRLEDGRLVRIAAAAESLLEVRAENPLRLTRLAWQLGSNHVALEVTAEALYVKADPVVADLVRGQGCLASAVERPFRPEREVVAHDHSQCGHDHSHDHHHHEPHAQDHRGQEHHGQEHQGQAHQGQAHHGHDHHRHDHGHDHGHAHHHDHGHSHGH
ncbi:UreE urease accessory domain protein [Methylobacterium sp. 4-46]|uniref:urease accessory protein UreE n=1 Tax=unclassified Methylobacterium TaxID=2615210 RepID=UPI000152DEC0|nr:MULTISPECIES: urease accessory protein UreE [Methylobacterium]ACA18720.1 UreE urease accessory domain protein [Methylobacterium sp. 4-46]WFT77951.1 urease accessory protein UreE [Methylobacterium nodulans]